MPYVPPWLNINPLDYITAATSGGKLGTERASLATQANEAAGRLGLGYAQLGQEGGMEAARIAAQSAMAAARLREEQNRAHALQDFRESQLGLREQGLSQAQDLAAQRTGLAEQGLGLREQEMKLRDEHASFLDKLRQAQFDIKLNTNKMSDLDKLRWHSAQAIFVKANDPKLAFDEDAKKQMEPQLKDALKTMKELTDKYTDTPAPVNTDDPLGILAP